jgi:hypothetical protein
MAALLADDAFARRLGASGRELTRRVFDGDAMVRSIEGLYEELLR